MPADLTALLDDLAAEHADVDALVDGRDLAAPSAAAGWTVGDCLGHLWFFDREAAKALVDPDAFMAGLERIAADIGAYMDAHLDEARALGTALPESARAARATLLAALADVDPAAKVPWYGPPMSPPSFATARLMEYWAHGQDIADGLGVMRTPTDRLRHICHLGVRTRGFSFAVRGLAVPDTDVRVEVTGPHGDRWTWGDAEAADSVTGTALDFALVVTQRRLAGDTALIVEGDTARAWMSVAQAFAGAPTTTDPERRKLARAEERI
ncbi:MAG: hypothetical protein QOG34_2499 [Frankiaceae bacterium]|nr:hypothetical protein [Frankiaceae bacterium]